MGFDAIIIVLVRFMVDKIQAVDGTTEILPKLVVADGNDDPSVIGFESVVRVDKLITIAGSLRNSIFN